MNLLQQFEAEQLTRLAAARAVPCVDSQCRAANDYS